MKESLDNKVLAITGGTGTFGNALLQLQRFRSSTLAEIRIFSRDEEKQDDERRKQRSNTLTFYLGDVRERVGLEGALTAVDNVFHAPALKQVPLCEFFPMEAVDPNAVGTDNVLSASIVRAVRGTIVLSTTDKAVCPINAMGISKAMMEKIAIAQGPRGR